MPWIETSRPPDSRRSDLLLGLGVSAIFIVWALAWRGLIAQQGLFRLAGVDFGVYLTQAKLLLSTGGSAVYDSVLHTEALQALVAYSTTPHVPLLAAPPAAYPPLFLWLLSPLAQLPPPVGLGLWSGLNFIAALQLARRAAQLFRPRQRLLVAGLVLGSFPVFFALLVGQPVILLGYTLGEAYLAFREGRDLRGGLLVSTLLLKPQYGVLIGVILIVKRRWRAVSGALAGGTVVLVGSLWAAGPESLATYPKALSDMSGFKGTGTLTFPTAMINWRGLILRLAPNIDDRGGIALTLALSVLTAGLALWAWRGSWRADAEDFSARWVALISATLLANYHSHAHGAVLLVVPLCAFIAEGHAGITVKAAIKVSLILPPAIFALTYNPDLVAWPTTLSLLCVFAFSLWQCRALRGVPNEDRRHVIAVGLAPA